MHTTGPVPRRILKKAEQIIDLFQWLTLIALKYLGIFSIFPGGPKLFPKN